MTTIIKRPLLSIVIPTYNRADCLDLNLKHLTAQVTDDLMSKIEVIVSDNCSQDNTKQILKKYQDYSYIKTNFNSENLGMDLNFLKLVQESTGQFCWIFGDDEVLLNNGLEKVIRLLEANPTVGVIYIKPIGHKDLVGFNNKEVFFEKPKIQSFENSEEFLEKVSFNISFITSHIFNKSYTNSKLIADDLFIGTCLNHISFYFQAALHAKKNIFMEDNIFSQLINNSGGYRLFQVFGTNQQKILNHFKDFGLAKKTVQKINEDLLKYFFPTFIILMNAKNKNNVKSFFTESAFNILFANFRSYRNFWLFCFPLLVIPADLRLWLFRCAQAVNRKRKYYRNKIRALC